MSENNPAGPDWSAHTWTQVNYALKERIGQIESHRALALDKGGPDARHLIQAVDPVLAVLHRAEADVIDILRDWDIANGLLEPEPEDDVAAYKRQRDIIEDHGYPLISVGER